MCSHFQGLQAPVLLQQHFGVAPPPQVRADVWPGQMGCFVRACPAPARTGAPGLPAREACEGLFGLVPHWATDTEIARFSYQARIENVAAKPSYRDAWKKAQHCIIPAEYLFETDWSSGRAVPTALGFAGGEPLGIAGLWASWTDARGTAVLSFALLTRDAQDLPLMGRLRLPGDAKRIAIILAPERYGDWLAAPPEHSLPILQAPDDTRLQVLAPTPALARLAAGHGARAQSSSASSSL